MKSSLKSLLDKLLEKSFLGHKLTHFFLGFTQFYGDKFNQYKSFNEGDNEYSPRSQRFRIWFGLRLWRKGISTMNITWCDLVCQSLMWSNNLKKFIYVCWINWLNHGPGQIDFVTRETWLSLFVWETTQRCQDKRHQKVIE